MSELRNLFLRINNTLDNVELGLFTCMIVAKFEYMVISYGPFRESVNLVLNESISRHLVEYKNSLCKFVFRLLFNWNSPLRRVNECFVSDFFKICKL